MADIKNKSHGNEKEKPIVVAKNAAELQRIRLDKLMKKGDKPVHIPEASKDYKPRDPLEFIRNVWGSSAGAGSGDFHVYRGVRRREYARQKFNKEKSEKEEADEAYQKKVEDNVKVAEDKTAKKRAKRLKKKQKQKGKKKQKKEEEREDSEDDDEEDEEEDDKDDDTVEKDEEVKKASDNVTDNSEDNKNLSDKSESGGER